MTAPVVEAQLDVIAKLQENLKRYGMVDGLNANIALTLLRAAEALRVLEDAPH